MLTTTKNQFAVPVSTDTTLGFDNWGPVGSAVNGTTLTTTLVASPGTSVFVELLSAGAFVPSSATYNGTTMTPLGSVALNGSTANGALYRWWLKGVGTGKSATIAIAGSGFSWYMGYGYSMKNVTATTLSSATTSGNPYGTGTSLSHVVTSSSGLILQSFGQKTPNNFAITFSSLSGGTNFYQTNYSLAGGVCVSFARDAATTFSATSNLSQTWGSLAHIIT